MNVGDFLLPQSFKKMKGGIKMKLIKLIAKGLFYCAIPILVFQWESEIYMLSVVIFVCYNIMKGENK